MDKICNLNLIIKKKKVETTQMLGFLTSVTLKSYLKNSDGDGVYFSSNKRLIKGKKKINLCLYPKSICKSKFILTHQRISTSGYEEKYTQPFKSKKENFVLVHNGIMDQFKGTVGSDTFGYFFNYFLEEFRTLKGSREKKIIDSINNTLKDCIGSYSIGLFDIKRNVLYYFKNQSRYITFYKSDDDNLLYITSNEDNKQYLEFFNRNFSEIEIKEKRIYKITIGDSIIVKKVGKIKETPNIRSSYQCGKPYNSYNDGYGYRNRQNLITEKGDKTIDIFKQKDIIQEDKKMLALMFENHFYKKENKGDLEDKLLETEVDIGLTLEDIGYSKSLSGGGICGRCYHLGAEFISSFDIPICRECLERELVNMTEEMYNTTQYINYGDQWDEHF